LPLHFDGAYDDIEMLASLDRIDSDGHYEPGTFKLFADLQIAGRVTETASVSTASSER